MRASLQLKDWIMQALGGLAWVAYWPVRVVAQASYRPASVRRVLILGTSLGLGNLIMLIPFLRTLKESQPGISITLLTNRRIVPELLLEQGEIDEVVTFKLDYRLSLWARARSVRRALRERHFDLALATFLEPPLPQTSLFLFLSGAPYRASYNVPHYGFSETFLLQTEEWQHEVERHLGLARRLGFWRTVSRISLSVPPADAAWAHDFLPPGFRDARSLLGLHPGSALGQEEKRWPWERFVEVAEWFSTQIGGRVIFFGGPDDTHVLARIKGRLRAEVLFAESLPLRRVIALIQRCTVFLSNDSGLMHLAAALHVPLVAIFGPTIPAKNHPWQAPHTLLQRQLPCSPCYQYRQINCPRPRCLEEISVAEVCRCLQSYRPPSGIRTTLAEGATNRCPSWFL